MSALNLKSTSGGAVAITPANTAGNFTLTAPAETSTLLTQASGAANAVYNPAGTGAVATTVQTKLRESVSVKDFGAVGDGVTDDTAAIQAALSSGKSLLFPRGVYLTGPLSVPASQAGNTHQGEGWVNYGGFPGGTVLKALTDNQTHVIALANGADGVVFCDIAFDGADKALKCIDGTYGAFFSLRNAGVYNSKNYGFYGKQGLAKISHVYSSSHAQVGFQIYSDSWVSDSEFNGGTEPLRIVAGGCRLTGVLANSGTVSCITLEPFDSATNHINTSITNCYIGEVRGGASEVPIIKIRGISAASQYVWQVQISNSHFVSAALSGSDATNKNICVDIDYARGVSITGCTALGVALAYQSTTRHMSHFVAASRCYGLSVQGNNVENCAKSPIKFYGTLDGFSVGGNVFFNYSQNAAIAAGADLAAVKVDAAVTAYGVVSNNMFNITASDIGQIGLNGGDTDKILYTGNLHRFATSVGVVPATGVLTADWLQAGIARHRLTSCGILNQSWSGPFWTLGSYALWVDATGDLRIKNGSPTSDLDGAVVGTQS